MKKPNGSSPSEFGTSGTSSASKGLASRAVLVYIAVVAVGTLLHLHVSVPPTFFSDKRNFFNLIFVKLGWVRLAFLA
jgi:hypothetical protein